MPIEIRGVDKLMRKLGTAAANKTLEPPMQRGVFRLQRFMQEYPPPPASSKYVRTGTEGRRWTTRIESSQSGLKGRVGNNVPYAPYVQSSMYQTVWHRRTGWKTDVQAVAANEKVIMADFQSAIDRALAS